MLGTLNGALEARGVKLPPEGIRAAVEGINEVVDGIPMLRQIRVHYTLRIPPETREAVERALARHGDKCPTARSLRGAVEVSWSADIVEADRAAAE
ncbi:MAG TPA: OsmC family protein [Longimicrobiales bacterium]